jgi:predicted ATPase
VKANRPEAGKPRSGRKGKENSRPPAAPENFMRCGDPPTGERSVDSVGLVIATLAVENYRSLRRLVVPLAQLTVVTGANGAGKSSLYRALRLLADAARKLLAPRPAGLLVLNEPETSLHWQLLAPLANLIAAAAARSQIIAVSHSQTLINALQRATAEAGISTSTIELIKDFGETSVAGREPLDGPAWHWPKR